MKDRKPKYASAGAVRRGLATVENIGASVGRVIYRPDGSFEFVIGPSDHTLSEFDQLEAAGVL